MHVGLVGFPLTHSFSPDYFTHTLFPAYNLEGAYRLYPLEDIRQLFTLIRDNSEIDGLNVTIPYKQAVLEFCDVLQPEAKQIGAVNCIKIERKGNKVTLHGYNTDWFGFFASLEYRLAPLDEHIALVLGTGGSSAAIVFALKKLGYRKIVSVSRTKNDGAISYAELTETILKNCTLVVNTTPLGMYPNIMHAPEFPFHFLSEKTLVYDLIYNPEQTLFLKRAAKQGCPTINGLQMLQLQAEESLKIWLG